MLPVYRGPDCDPQPLCYAQQLLPLSLCTLSPFTGKNSSAVNYFLYRLYLMLTGILHHALY